MLGRMSWQMSGARRLSFWTMQQVTQMEVWCIVACQAFSLQRPAFLEGIQARALEKGASLPCYCQPRQHALAWLTYALHHGW